MADAPVLEVRGIKVGYGPIKAIRDCSLEVAAGETVAVAEPKITYTDQEALVCSLENPEACEACQ